MIAFVRGRVAGVQVDGAVVEVGGVGLQIACTPGTLATLRVGQETTLATSLVVREDSLTLFGFADDEERTLFELLQTASGVGPKLAQAMLAVHGPDQLRRAVVGEDLTALCRVPGVGRKGAQRIVLELKDRIGAPSGAAVAAPAGGPASTGTDWQREVRGALLGLGWSVREADAAVDSVTLIAEEQVEAGNQPSTAELLRAALRSLSRA